MGRILSIDFGRKRVGLAVTDPLKLIANNLSTIPNKDIFPFLEKYLQEEEIDEMVIGYPRQMNNKPSESVKYIDPFIKKITTLYPDIPVFKMDERFTSKIAIKSMVEGGLKKSKRRNKEMIDTISANLILQSYLEYKKNKI